MPMMNDSDDNCSACLESGNLICCDSCPRVFHYFCIEEGRTPEGAWYCSHCTAKKEPVKEEYHGIFSGLLKSIRYINPKMFELPQDIIDQYEHVFAHPTTGVYMNDNDCEITLGKSQYDNFRATRKTSTAGTLPLADQKIELELKDNDAEKSTSESIAYATCFKCCKTDLKINQTSFLNSHSVPSLAASVNIQCQRSELIQCDYCKLYWHLDCLNPPLTTIPYELRLDDVAVLDIKAHSELKAKLWKNYSPLDPVLHKVPALPTRKHFSATHMPYFNNCSPDSPFLEQNRFIKIRKKWMCPCHAEWEVPPLKPKMKLAIVDLQRSSPIINKRQLFRVIPENESNDIIPEAATIPLPAIANNGHIIIENESDQINIFDAKETNFLYSIPESRIKLEFMSKLDPNAPILDQVSSVSMVKPLAEKFIEFGNKFDCNVGELYQYEDLEMNHQPIVQGLIEEENLDADLHDV